MTQGVIASNLHKQRLRFHKKIHPFKNLNQVRYLAWQMFKGLEMNDTDLNSTMFVLVLHRVAIPLEAAMDAIGRVLGLGAYEARMKANIGSPGPVVAATSADRETLEIYAETLTGLGVPAFVVGNHSGRQPFVARRVGFSDGALVVESRDGGRVQMPYAQAKLLLRGMGLTDLTTTETETSRKLSLGRAVLSSGLLITKKVETVRSQTSSKRTSFMLVYDEQTVIALDEESLQYDGLGDQMKATRSLNFEFVCGELIRRAPTAIHDDRLKNRARHVQILGPSLSPENNLDLLTEILAKSLAI